ncbi:MAG: hypothetical protein ACLVIW_10560, partial [Bilophila wadsworthia]
SSFRPGLKERLYQTVDGEMREPPEHKMFRRFLFVRRKKVSPPFFAHRENGQQGFNKHESL